MVFTRSVRVVLLTILAISAICEAAVAQSAIDTMTLVPVPPDSFYLRREGSSIIIGWYPAADSLTTVLGSRDYRDWYSVYPVASVSSITVSGEYTGDVDRTLKISRSAIDTVQVGVTPSIAMEFTLEDEGYQSFTQKFNIGTNYTNPAGSYTPGDPIPVRLVGNAIKTDTLDLGISIHFWPGMIGSDISGGGFAFARIDLQDFEGFHVWRGLSPNPSEMQAICEISKEDYFRVGMIDEYEDVPETWKWLWLYFRGGGEEGWPRYDSAGRKYYEWIDSNVYSGFSYYYVVTCFDRGYFNGFFEHNKEDNFVCDEDIENPADPGSPVPCSSVSKLISMTMDAGTDLKTVFAVPNPYRTGTSAATSPYYHNFPDMSIRFFNVPMEAQIKIFTVAGDLVWETVHSSLDGSDGMVSWDVKNQAGEDVCSGVYMFRCERNDGEAVYGRIVVIR